MKLLKNISRSLLLSIALISSSAMADSPLTSTEFTSAYPEYNIIQEAANNKKPLTNEQAKFLASQDIPVGARAALVNALSWDPDGQTNALLFLNYLQNQDVNIEAAQSPKEYFSNAPGELIALYAYLLAADNYFDVEGIDVWVDMALEKTPKSLTINMIKALIDAQVAMDSDCCKVYQLVDEVRNNKELEQDLKEDAVKNIFEYIEGYKSSCK